MSADNKHPADEIAKALSRAGGILTLLSSCYDKGAQRFETGGNFVYESILTVEAMMAQASEALARLYQTCDLSIIREAPAEAVAQAAPAVEEAVASEEAAPADVLPMAQAEAASAAEPHSRYVAAPGPSGSYLGFFGPQENGSRLSERLDNALPRSFGLERAPATPVLTGAINRPAENYDELLQKLTAVADQAAFQAHQSPGERNLLPALEGLRADLIKLRSVA
ncbi:MAG: hypothetical protein KGO53_08870 [Alphaproteobacteria bacterium]|nr:hypothetical protein [Alphaproteobacteria bacterium]